MIQKNGYYKSLDDYLYELSIPWWITVFNVVCFMVILYMCFCLKNVMFIIRYSCFLLGGVLIFDYIVFKYQYSVYKKVQKYKEAVIQGSRRYYALYKLKRKCNFDFDVICLDQYIYANLGLLKTFKVFNYLIYLRKCLTKDSVYKRFLTFDHKYQIYKSSMSDLPDFTDEKSFKKRFPDGDLDYAIFRKFEEQICKYYDFDVVDNFTCTVEISYFTRFFQILEEQSFDYDTIITLCRMIDEDKNFTSGYYRTIFNMSECTRFILKGA